MLRTVPSVPYNGLDSTFLSGDGAFRVPVSGGGPAGGVTSVGLTAPPEFTISGSPVTASGTLDFQFQSPLLVAHGGTGTGTLGSNAIVATGLTSSAAFTAILLNQMGSAYLTGAGVFSFPPSTAKITVPTIASGGGNGPSITGTDRSFVVAIGSGGIASSVTVAFGRPWTTIPKCVANHQGAILVTRCVPSASQVVIDAATPFTALGLIDVICSGFES